MTIADITTNAELSNNSARGPPHYSLNGSALSISAASVVDSKANAKAKDDDAGTVGIGAGVAINIVNDTTTASIDSGATFDATSKPSDVTLSATDTDTMTTYSEAGVKAKPDSDVALTPDVSISYPTVITSATIGGAQLGLYHAFIQFAGFTFGRAYSFFDAPWQSYPAGGPDTLPGGSNHVTGVNQVAYTAQFGNGASASIALQDPTVYDTTNIFNLSFPGGVNPSIGPNGTVNFLVGYGAPSIAGALVAPDVVGNIKVDQAWGSAMLSAVAHDNHAGYYGFNETFGHPSDKWGWAIQGALSVKAPMLGPGDVFNMQAVYTDGASRYNFQSLFPTT